MLLRIIPIINFIKNLPSHIKLDSLTYHFELIAVLILEIAGLFEVVWVILVELLV